MLLEAPNYEQWTADQLAEYISQHITEAQRPQVRQQILERNLDGRALAAMDRETWLCIAEDIAKAANVNSRLLTPIKMKLDLCQEDIRELTNHIIGLRRVPQFDFVYNETDKWCLDRGGRPYYNPAGWQRFGFYPDLPGEDALQAEEMLKGWHVAYHGTPALNLQSIVELGLLPPGADTKDINGKKIECVNCGASKHGEGQIFVSPSIEYSSHYLYTKPQPLKQSSDEFLYLVFQVRIRPGTFTVRGNTFADCLWGDRTVTYDDRFGPDEMEWVLTDANNVRVTGLMVRVLKGNPQTRVQELFKRNQERARKVRGPGKGVWHFNSAPGTASTLTPAGPWQAYKPDENERIERAYQNWQKCVYLGDVATEEGPHRYFVDFGVMEQIRTDDNKLRRLIKREVAP
eukprot:TRINITY_DN14375_c0_g1_i1.p1 TRINITY_DN14375_c0_g1~~TRINITY_DN14375_c0_g1_i1.p1  ORF type:complete len:402 (-),score=67.23 TRINITY_DN14375_c0_g1_i1:1138-2343(-)